MFAHRYFSARYWAERFFPPVDAPAAPSIVTEAYLFASSGSDVSAAASSGRDVSLSAFSGGDVLLAASVGVLD